MTTRALSRSLRIEQFRLFTFPCELDKYCIVIMSEQEHVRNGTIKNLLTYLINSFYNVLIVSGSSSTSFFPSIKTVGEFTACKDRAQKQLAIVDYSEGGIFKDVHPEVISYMKNVDEFPRWLKSHYSGKILNPNMLQQSPEVDWDKNVSHTIWLCDKMGDIPASLLTNSHLVFVLDETNLKEYLLKRVGVANFKYNGSIYVTTSTLSQDMRLMTLARSRFMS